MKKKTDCMHYYNAAILQNEKHPDYQDLWEHWLARDDAVALTPKEALMQDALMQIAKCREEMPYEWHIARRILMVIETNYG